MSAKDILHAFAELDAAINARRREGGIPVAQVDGEDIDASIDFVSPDGDGTFAVITVGVKGALNRDMLRVYTRTWLKATARWPKAFFMLNIAGYDDDPRPLWEIPEPKDYLCRFARRVGLHSLDDAQDKGLNSYDIALLAKCGAFGEEIAASIPVTAERVPPDMSDVLQAWDADRRKRWGAA
jgi:hypothetical protein